MLDSFGIEILYEDNHVLFVKKPFGLLVQEDNTKEPDLLSILKNDIKEKYKKSGNVYLGMVHRLDRPVGGVMVFAKTSKAASRLSEQVRNRKFIKVYTLILEGKLEQKEGTLQNYLLKNHHNNTVRIVDNYEEGKFAQLNYRVLEENKKRSLVEVELQTGRSHQIRVQFSALGAPLFGDKKYGGNENPYYRGIALWASQLTVFHPITQKAMTIHARLPDTFPWNEFKDSF